MELKEMQKEKLLQLKIDLEAKKQHSKDTLNEGLEMRLEGGGKGGMGVGRALGSALLYGAITPQITTYETLIKIIDILLEQ